jgi:teichuronic acid exporter
MSAETDHESRKLDGAIAGGLAWTAGAKSVTQLISWLSALIAARLLSKADFGLVSMAGFIANLIAVLAEFGLGTAALQMPELDSAVVAQLNTCSVSICAAMYGLTVLAAPLVAAFFKSDQLRLLVIVNSLGLLLTGFQSVPNALLQKDLDYRRLSLAEAVQALLMAAVTIVCAWMGFAYWSLVAGALTGRLGGTILTYWWRPVGFKFPRWKQVEGALRLGSHVAVSRIASAAFLLSDGVIVGRMLGDSALGAYQWAMNFASAPSDKVGLLIMRVSGPLFARTQKDLDLVRRYFRIVTESVSLTVFPLMFGLAVVAPEAVQVVLGPQWAEAAGPIRWLAIFMGLRNLSTLASQALTSLRFTRFNMWVALLSFVLMPAAFLLASRWGTTAVAASWIVLSPVTVLPLIVKLLRTIQMRYRDYAGVLAPALVASAAMVAAVLALRMWLTANDMRLALKLSLEVSAGGVAYVGVLLLFFRDRLNRYFHFVMALRRGNAALPENDLP